MGGRSIFVLEQGDKNRNVVFETLTDYGTRYASERNWFFGEDGRIWFREEKTDPRPGILFRKETDSRRGILVAPSVFTFGPGFVLLRRDQALGGRAGNSLRSMTSPTHASS